MLAITICATKNYTYAMRAQADLVLANLRAAATTPGTVYLVGDTSTELADVAAYYRNLLPKGWDLHLEAGAHRLEGGENYKEQAQRRIAEMRQTAFNLARKADADRCWSLDSDVLPPANALRCMETMLDFDGGYYSVSTCPYPNGLFLGGCGTPHHPIAEDWLPTERKLPDALRAEYEANEAELKKLQAEKAPVTDEHRARWEATSAKIKECPPDGNIWEVIAKHGWRRRGWLDHAYPAIGLGSVVPSDWCGFGCTLMNREALALAQFHGYDGKGTEDLYICWRRWHSAGLRLNVIPHCPCDHVIWQAKKNGDPAAYTHHIAYHEPTGEMRGHLRTRTVPWIPETLLL